MPSTSDLLVNNVDDEQLLQLAERIAALRLSTDSRNGLRDPMAHSRTVSCFSFLRDLFSSRSHAYTTPYRSVVHPLGTTQSDPGVVERHLQNAAPPRSLPGDPPLDIVGPGSVASSFMAPGISALDLERIHDASFKRAKDTQLPVGGAFKGHSDSRSVDMFLQEVRRTPGWSVGVMPELFQSYYLEFSLDTSVRGVIMGMVETNLKDCGLDGYEALRARVKAIEVALRTRFDSINSHRILADTWESMKWDPSEDFDEFYLRFQQVRDSYSRQRGQELQNADVVERLFGALPKDYGDRLIRQYGVNPDESKILEFCRRENMILVRNRNSKGGSSHSNLRSNVHSVTFQEDGLVERPDGFFVMPVEQATSSTQTNNRLFVSNLAFNASERELLGAFRSVLRLTGAIPRAIRIFKDGRSGKSRGIGLIEFDTPDAATKALDVVDGQQVLGRRIRARRDRGASISSSTTGETNANKRRRTDDPSSESGEENTTAVSGSSPATDSTPTTTSPAVGVHHVQHETDENAPLDQFDDPPTTLPDGSLCAVIDSLSLGQVDYDQADIVVELRGLGQSSLTGKSLTTIATTVTVGQNADTLGEVEWLLDSGCALHLIDKDTHPWLCNARSVPLTKPVKLIFANGTSQLVHEAKLVVFACGSHRLCSHVLVVEGLTVSCILSLHQLANDFGAIAWCLNDNNNEVLRLGSDITLQPISALSSTPACSAPVSTAPLVEVFSMQSTVCNVEGDQYSSSYAAEVGKADLLMNDIDRPPDVLASSDGEPTCTKSSRLKVDYVQDGDGHSRACVGLPWLSEDRPDCNTPGLQSSVAAARDRITCKKLASLGPEWLDQLSHELDDMVSQGHIRPLTREEMMMNPPVMSAVVVLRPGHPTQPLRVTIDARPLNQFLGTGDTSVLSQALQRVLLRWRLAPFTCWDDVCRAFLQVLLRSEDSLFLNFRILGKTFRCERLPFGLICSPAILSSVLESCGFLLNDIYGNGLAAFSAYMDDLLYTAWSLDKLLVRRQHGRDFLIKKYRMECQPSKAILGYDPSYACDSSLSQLASVPSPNTTTSAKILGYNWNLQKDSLSVILSDANDCSLKTRRECFQTLSKFFDPLGICIEAVSKERYLLREAACKTASWDSQDVPNDLVLDIKALFNANLPPQPRFTDVRSGIVVYCDAAGSGCICAAARAIASGRRIIARQRSLNPSWSIARLELCGLLLAAELLSTILRETDVVINDGYSVGPLWILTDSQLNAWRLRRSPSLDGKYLPKFELRRMRKLRERLHHVVTTYKMTVNVGQICGRRNPADCATRPNMRPQSQMMVLSSEDIKMAVEDAKVVSTFTPVTNFDNYGENDDDLDVTLEVEDEQVNAVIALQKEPLLLQPDEELHRQLKLAQTVCPTLQEVYAKLKSSDGMMEGYELREDLIYKVGNVSLDDSNRGSCTTHQIIVPDSCRDVQALVVKWVHDKHGGHPGRTTLTRWVWRSFYWKRVDTAVRALNRNCEGCQARRIAANRRRTQSTRPPGCSVQYEPFAIAYFDVMGPYQLSKTDTDASNKLYVFTLSCHSSKFVKCEAAHDKSGYSASQALFKMLSDEGPVRVLVVDQGLNVPEVMSVADEWNAIVVAAPPRGEELRGWGERAHRDVHAVLRGCLWDLSAERRLPNEDEFLRLVSRAVTVVNMTPYIDGSPLCPLLVCRGHSRMIGDLNAKAEAEDIRKAILDGLEPPTWWTEDLAKHYREQIDEGHMVTLKELADVWWMRRRDIRSKLLSRVQRHANRDLKEGSKVYRWRPTLGKFGKLNSGWYPAILVKRLSNSVCKIRLPDGKETTESVLNLRPAGVCR